MSLTKKQKKQVQELIGHKSISEIAKEVGATQKVVFKYISKYQTDKKRTTKINRQTQLVQEPPRTLQKTSSKAPKIKDLSTFKDFHMIFLDFLILVILLILLIYANSLKGDFVSDDISGIIQNPTFINSTVNVANSEINELVHFFLYKLFGANPTPFHVFSIGMHATNSYLVFLLLSQIFRKKSAMIATILFAVHPINTEAVSWISGINYVINAFVILVTLNLHVIYKNTGKKAFYTTSVVFYFVAVLLTRNPWISISLPILVVFDQFFLQNKPHLTKHKVREYLPFMIILSLYMFFFMAENLQTRANILNEQFNFAQGGKTSQMYTIPYSISQSAKLYPLPMNLTLYHEGEQISTLNMTIMILFSIMLIVSTVLLYRKSKIYSGMVLIILLSIAPTFSPIQLAWFVAERYLYFGTIAFCMIVASLLVQLEQKSQVKNSAILFTFFLVLFYSAKTISRNADWRSHKSLWEATVQVSPNSKRVYNNLGDVYSREGDQQKAINMFLKAIELDPNYADAYHNLGNTLLITKNFNDAKQSFLNSVQANPNIYQNYYKLGILEYNLQNYTAALEYFRTTQNLATDFPQARIAAEITQKTIDQTVMPQEQESLMLK